MIAYIDNTSRVMITVLNFNKIYQGFKVEFPCQILSYKPLLKLEGPRSTIPGIYTG